MMENDPIIRSWWCRRRHRLVHVGATNSMISLGRVNFYPFQHEMEIDAVKYILFEIRFSKKYIYIPSKNSPLSIFFRSFDRGLKYYIFDWRFKLGHIEIRWGLSVIERSCHPAGFLVYDYLLNDDARWRWRQPRIKNLLCCFGRDIFRFASQFKARYKLWRE